MLSKIPPRVKAQKCCDKLATRSAKIRIIILLKIFITPNVTEMVQNAR